MYPGMKRLTLTVVAVLLAVPAVAHAKAGIEFDQDITTQKPGEEQGFTAFVHGSSGGPPTVSFHNSRSGKVITVKTVRTNDPGIGRGFVRLPDRGPWRVTMVVNGRSIGEVMGQTFELGPPKLRVMGTMEPPPDPPSTTSGSGGGFPFWLLTLPAAGLAALGLWFVRRRPRELGT